MTIKLLCDNFGPCAFHADGGSRLENCPDLCDMPGCRRRAPYEIEGPLELPEHPAHLCAHHLLDVIARQVRR